MRIVCLFFILSMESMRNIAGFCCGRYKTCFSPKNRDDCITDPQIASELASKQLYLKDLEYKDTTPFIPPIVVGKVIKVYDGDTITIASKLPNCETPIYRFSVRLSGIDSAEIKGKTSNEKRLAILARDRLHELIFGKMVHLKQLSTEKYGRILADVYLDNLHVNKWMLDNGLAVPYDGGTKHRPAEWDSLC